MKVTTNMMILDFYMEHLIDRKELNEMEIGKEWVRFIQKNNYKPELKSFDKLFETFRYLHSKTKRRR